MLMKIGYAIIVAKIGNFVAWFVISLGDGSMLVNTSFNLGYNCLLLDWLFLSGVLLILALVSASLAAQIVPRLRW